MDVERKDLEEGLTDHPVVARGIYALTYEVFEVEERAPSISPPSVEEITYASDETCLEDFAAWKVICTEGESTGLRGRDERIH